MIDSKLRQYAQPTFDRIGKGCIRIGTTSLILTWAGFFIGIFSGVSLVLQWDLLALVLLWISGLLDVLDGTVARITSKANASGAFMDLIFDRMVEAAVVLGLAWKHPEFYMIYLLFFVSVIFNFSTFLAAGSLFKNTGEKSMHYDIGLAERTETFLVLTILILFPSSTVPVMGLFVAVIFLTGILRFRRVLAG